MAHHLDVQYLVQNLQDLLGGSGDCQGWGGIEGNDGTREYFMEDSGVCYRCHNVMFLNGGFCK